MLVKWRDDCGTIQLDLLRSRDCQAISLETNHTKLRVGKSPGSASRIPNSLAGLFPIRNNEA